MSTTENNKITSKLFLQDIRNEDLNKDFERVFEIQIKDILSGYEYYEIDEFPLDIENQGVMIGFVAETSKVPPQIEYIDLDISNYPRNINYLAKTIPDSHAFLKSELIKSHLSLYTNLRIYHSLYNIKQIERVIFQYEDLRYELSVNVELAISRIRVCFSENKSSVNMRTYYPFGISSSIEDKDGG